MADTEKRGYTVVLGLDYGVVTMEPGDIQQFYFVEDVFSFCMSGKMVFEDRFGFVEYGPFTGNERLMLVYGEQESRRLLFDIIKVEKITMSSSTLSSQGTQIAVYFVDTTYRYFTKRKFSRSWSEGTKSKDILDHILHKWCEGDGENEKIILKRYDDTDSTVHFISPWWTPMECMLWLNRRTKPKPSENIGNELGGYLYYNNTYWDSTENDNKDNNFTAAWKSINGLFSYPVSKSKSDWIDYNTFTFSGSPINTEDTQNRDLTYVNKVLDWRYGGVDFTNIKKLRGGHMLSYNFDGKLFIDRSYKYSKTKEKKNESEDTKADKGVLDEITLLGEKSLFPNISEMNADIILNGTPNEDELDYMFYTDWLRNYSKQQVLSVIVRGWEGRFAGQVIKDVYWKSAENENKAGNKNLIGPYIVKSVTHNFGTKQGYTQRLVLMKNAYYKSNCDSLIDVGEGLNNSATGGEVLRR